MTSPITTHVLDTGRGRPGQGIEATLERAVAEGGWQEIGRGRTDDDGRIGNLLPPDHPLAPGIYCLRFAIGAYFAARGEKTFYPEVRLTFEVTAPDEHYHVPLLLNAFGYSTYRGS